jgi:hypothetical protein
MPSEKVRKQAKSLAYVSVPLLHYPHCAQFGRRSPAGAQLPGLVPRALMLARSGSGA